MCGVCEHACGISEPDIDDVIGDGFSGSYFEEPAEGCGCHSGEVGEFFQPDFLLVVGVDVVVYFGDSPAIGIIFYSGER